MSVAGAAARCGRIGSLRTNVPQVGEIVVVRRNALTHFDVRILLSGKPGRQLLWHVPHHARLQPVEANAIELMLAGRPLDTHFHTRDESK